MATVSSQATRNIKPTEGMLFNTINDAFEFYNSYAKEVGFSARKSSTKSRKGILSYQKFICYKEGEHDSSKKFQDQISSEGTGASITERIRGIVRTGCKAKMGVSKRQNATQFTVTSFEECHNHELATPRKSHLLSSHRKVSKAKKILTDHLADANVSTSQQVRVLAAESGGFQNIGCTERDLRNHLRDQREKQSGVDAATLLGFFELQQQKDPSFYFAFDKDSEGRMTRCFWADSESRWAYTCFSDVVLFDTTYNTNKYSMIFAPIVGINQHDQNTLFGCAFLSDETTESFIWFFQQFKLSMLTCRSPQIIITDQDPAMTKAIGIELPTTFHRYCIWHITMKFQEKIGPMNFSNFYSLFQSSIYNSETIEEFEYSWREALNQSSLHDHIWLKSIYDIRRRWIPAHVNHIFAAGCSASQRAESGHAFIKKYVAKENSLMDFVTRYTLALQYQREKELNEDWSNINEKPKLSTLIPVEKQMAGIYSRKIFKEFQKELLQSLSYTHKPTNNENDYIIFRADGGSSKTHRLIYDMSTQFWRCSCKLFDFQGIPCRHMLYNFFVTQVIDLPEKYILQRWTKNAKGRGVRDSNTSKSDVLNKSLLQQRALLHQLCSQLIDNATISTPGAEFLFTILEEGNEKVKQFNLTHDHFQAPIMINIPEEQNIFDPKHVRAKGCGKRLKSVREISIRKGRLCHGCGLRDQAHDKRNCPALIGNGNENLSSDSSEQNDSAGTDSG